MPYIQLLIGTYLVHRPISPNGPKHATQSKHVRKTTETQSVVRLTCGTQERQAPCQASRCRIKLPRQAAASSCRVKLPRHPLTRHHQFTSTRCFEMHPNRDLHIVMVTRPAVRVPQSVLCASRRGDEVVNEVGDEVVANHDGTKATSRQSQPATAASRLQHITRSKPQRYQGYITSFVASNSGIDVAAYHT